MAERSDENRFIKAPLICLHLLLNMCLGCKKISEWSFLPFGLSAGRVLSSPVSVRLSVRPSVRLSVCPQRLCVTYFTAKAYLCDYLFYVTPLCDLGV